MDTHKGAPPTVCMPGQRLRAAKHMFQDLGPTCIMTLLELQTCRSVVNVRTVNARHDVYHACDSMKYWLAPGSSCRGSG